MITWLITKRQGLGYGDIQLIFVLGYWLGIYKILFVIFFSALSAIIFWLILNYLKEYDKNRALPFGSFSMYKFDYFLPNRNKLFI